MNNRPPQVSKPPTDIQLLSLERDRIRGMIGDIRAAMSDVGRYGAEGALYAQIAAMWGATLMVAEICKLGLAAGDWRARVMFNAQDKLVGQANKVLNALGRGTIATKDDVLKTLDPELRDVNKMAESMQTVRKFIGWAGISKKTRKSS